MGRCYIPAGPGTIDTHGTIHGGASRHPPATGLRHLRSSCHLVCDNAGVFFTFSHTHIKRLSTFILHIIISNYYTDVHTSNDKKKEKKRINVYNIPEEMSSSVVFVSCTSVVIHDANCLRLTKLFVRKLII